MEDRDSIKLLKECDAGSKMAVTSLDDVLEKTLKNIIDASFNGVIDEIFLLTLPLFRKKFT